MQAMESLLKHSVMPFLLLAAAVGLLCLLPSLPPLSLQVLPAMPAVFMGLGVLLSLAFNRSRFTWMLVTLLLAHAFYDPRAASAQEPRAVLLVLWVVTNFAVFGFFQDRGVFSVHGLLRCGFLALQGLLMLWLLHAGQLWLGHAIAWQAWPIPGLGHYWIWPQALLWAALSCVGVLVVKLALVPRHIEAGLLGALTAFLVAINSPDHPYWYALFMSCAALILCVAILLDSYHMAYRDELTGLSSRRALNQYLLSLGRKYTIAMLDVDHFKKFNDTHGHDVGDQVLKLVARKIACVTGGGRGFRYGGEEFTVIFPRKTPEQAMPHLEALREDIAAYEMNLRGRDRPRSDRNGKASKKRGATRHGEALSVTISIGVADRHGDLKRPEQVIKAADEALYRAKKKGRNCVSE